jgi:hypothetical protein
MKFYVVLDYLLKRAVLTSPYLPSMGVLPRERPRKKPFGMHGRPSCVIWRDSKR